MDGKVVVARGVIEDRLRLLEKAIQDDGADRRVAAESLLSIVRMLIEGKLVITGERRA